MLRTSLLRAAGLLALTAGLTAAQAQPGPPLAPQPAAAAQQRYEEFAGFGQAERDALGPQKAAIVADVVNTVQCPCGCGRGSLAVCRHTDPNCPVSPRLVARVIEIAKAEPVLDAAALTARIEGELQSQKQAQQQAREAAQRAEQERRSKIHSVPIGASPWKGVKHAKVTIVEFSEFQCPFCARVGPTLQRILDEYPGEVAFVFKHYPLPNHKMAGPAAEASIEAQAQKKFWKFHDKLFENQRSITQQNLELWAGELGMDVTALKGALETGKHRAHVQADQQLAEQVGVSATPTFYVNGRMLEGAQPYEAFKGVIEAERQRAQKLLDSGVPIERLYEELTKPGQQVAPAEGPVQSGVGSPGTELEFAL